MKNAVIYARSASFNEDSLRTQVVLCKKFADDNGYTVVRIFADNNASGRSAKRPALQKLLKDINSCWETIIILDHSRFFREPHKYIESPQLMIHTLIKKIVLYDDKIKIYYNYTDPIKPDGSSPEDSHRLFFIIDGSNLLHPAAPKKRHTLFRYVFSLYHYGGLNCKPT